MRETKPLAVSMGDPAGIGPDVTLMAAQRQHDALHNPWIAYGDPALYADRARRLGLDIRIVETSPDDIGTGAGWTNCLPVRPTLACHTREPGLFNPANGRATLDALTTALDDVLAGNASGLVTAPINKKVLYEAGFRHPGHTEFLGAHCRDKGLEADPVMMLASSLLRVVPITIHIPIEAVPAALSEELILRTVRIVNRDLRRFFGLSSPRLAVAGLNPHAGEDGSIGRQEIEIIAPAIARLRSEGVDVSGPYSADTMFHPPARARYDAAICMYHDQALIPIKTLSFDEGVNVTLGLPMIRTSPDHGTAYDIAGTGKARPQSFIAALEMAAQMSTSLHAVSTAAGHHG